MRRLPKSLLELPAETESIDARVTRKRLQPDIIGHPLVQVIPDQIHLNEGIVPLRRRPQMNMARQKRHQVVQTLIARQAALPVMNGKKSLLYRRAQQGIVGERVAKSRFDRRDIAQAAALHEV